MPALLLAAVVTLTQDVNHVAQYLAGKRRRFASVELLGWTAGDDLAYRTSVCDDDKNGERGAHCTVSVCTLHASDVPDCTLAIDEDVGALDFDRKEALASVQGAQNAITIADAGTRTIAKLDPKHDVVWVKRENLPAQPADPRRRWADHGVSRDLRVTAARKSHDGACIAIGGTAKTFAFAVLRCTE
jgi:hypothetical protein